LADGNCATAVAWLQSSFDGTSFLASLRTSGDFSQTAGFAQKPTATLTLIFKPTSLSEWQFVVDEGAWPRSISLEDLTTGIFLFNDASLFINNDVLLTINPSHSYELNAMCADFSLEGGETYVGATISNVSEPATMLLLGLGLMGLAGVRRKIKK
jgi:hypothetical protein